ncbi:MAG: hypothetical protein LH478_15230 [Chitinophagaceae bacterium]|nr:hypothetical protein [Chitinophagaceae bacterium]
MSRVLLNGCIIGLISLSSCGGNPPAQDQYMNTLLPATAVAIDTGKSTGLTVSQQSLPALPAQPNVASSMGAINPVHGKPGHRCDLSVGAPLSSPVQSAPVQFATPTLPAMPAQQNVASSMGALNPEHGKPGHRCDISVGAPLSTPVQSAPVQTPTQTLPAIPPLTNNIIGKGRLNPAHGQPGHDCAVPVGQPLKS